MQRILLFLFLEIILTANLLAQKQGADLIDSLKSDLVSVSKDTSRINILCRLSFEYARYNVVEGIKYGEQALDLAKRISWIKGIAYASNSLGANYFVKGEYPKALDYFFKSLSSYTEIGDVLKVATLNNNIGLIYVNQSIYNKAIEYLQRSLLINSKIKNRRGLSLNYGNLAIVYSNQNQYVKGNDYFNKALEIDYELNNKDAISRNLCNISYNKRKTKEYCDALEYGFKALRIGAEIKSNYNQGLCNQSIGETYYRLTLDPALSNRNCKHFKAGNLANLQLASIHLNEAILYFSILNDLQSISESSHLLSQIYEALGDHKKALAYYKQYVSNKDSIFSSEKSKIIAGIENRFEIEVRDKQLKIKSLKLENKSTLLIYQLFLSGIIILTLLIIALNYYRQKKIQKFLYNELHVKNLALEKNEEKLRVLFDTMPIGYYRSTLQGQCIDVNPAFVKMLGYDSREELLKVDIPSDVYYKDLERVEIIRNNKNLENSIDIYRLKTKDGKVIWVEDFATYKKDQNGEVIYNEGFCRDITDRKKSEKFLRESEMKYRFMFANNPQPMFIYDLETLSFLEVNQAFIDSYGYSREEFLTMTLRDIHLPEDNSMLIEDVERARHTNNPAGEWRHIKKNGDITYVEIASHSVTYNNNDARHVLLHDITDRKLAEVALRESEEKFRRLVTNIRDVLYSVDAETKEFKYLSPSFEKITGYSNEDIKKMGGREVFLAKVVTKDKFIEWDKNLEKLNETTKDVNLEHDTWWLCKDGSYKCLEDHWTPIYENGKLISTDGVLIDITERKHAEEAFKLSEEKFKDLFENMTNGFYRSTPAGYYVDANPAFIKMLGYDSKEDLLSVYIPTDLYVQAIDRDNLLKEIKDFDNDYEVYQLKTKDGRVIWIEDNARFKRDEQGTIIFHEGLCRDITDRKLAEEARRVSEEKYRLLFETMPNGYYLSSHEGYYVDVNPAFVKMLGYNSKEELLKVYIPQDVYVEPEERDYFIRRNSEFEDDLVTFRQKTKDGRIIWLEEYARYIKDEAGKVVFYEGICRDITDRKIAEERIRDSEQKLSTLFGSMTEMVVLHEIVLNDQGKAVNYRITDCNNSFSQVTGIRKDDAVGKLATEVYQVEQPPYLEEYSRVAQTGEPLNYTTFFEPMDKHFMVSVVSPKKGSFATITNDITEIKLTQDAMVAKKNELENYLFIASHDLRSPMVNIQGFSQRLLKQSDTIKHIISECQFESETKTKIESIIHESIPKTLGFIFSNVAKMDTLINGLLQISRTGRIKMNITRIDTTKLIRAIITGLNFQITELSVKVIIDDLPDCYGDENQLNQLFSNIIGNAIKYRDKMRPLTIEVKGRIQHNKVIYSIKDTGIGIPDKYLNKIWDVFFRVDANFDETGEGIGLSLVKRIIDKHRGKIWVESAVGKGSVFYVELLKNEFSE